MSTELESTAGDFLSNIKSKTISPPPPPIWAHLHAIEKLGPLIFCSNDPAAFPHSSPAIYTAPSLDDGEMRPYRRFRRFRNAAEAVALICAEKKDAQSISACAIELKIDAGGPKYLLKIARNGGFDDAALAAISKLLKETASEVDSMEWPSDSDATQRLKQIWPIAQRTLENIITLCRPKIRDTVTSAKATTARASIRTWAPTAKWEDRIPNVLDKTLAIQRLSIQVLARIDTNSADLTGQLAAAHMLAHSPVLLDMPTEAQSFVKRLARYTNAAVTLVRTFVYIATLHKQRAGSLFEVEAVNATGRGSVLTSAADSGTEPESFEGYLRTSFALGLKSLLARKVDQVRDSWKTARAHKTLFLHAELQLALFYMQNPLSCPIGGFIGVSKKCCYLCDFTIKHLQKDATSDPNYSEKTGPPFLFSVSGTHGGLTQNWRFPDPDQDIFTADVGHGTVGRQRLRNRLTQIRVDLALILKGHVEKMLPHLLDTPSNRRAEESDGSGDSDSDFDPKQKVMELGELYESEIYD